MQVSLDGLFRSVCLDLRGERADAYRYTLLELLGNIKELYTRKAEGEKVLDEFFQCYPIKTPPKGVE